MKLLLAILAVLFIFSCRNKDEGYHTPEDALDAGRSFIDNSLKGRFNTAKKYMLPDEDNNYWLTKISEQYNKYSEQEKAGFSQSSINILEVSDVVADSVTIINYTNSYKKQPQIIKIIKYNGEWKVDFKYTFSGNL